MASQVATVERVLLSPLPALVQAKAEASVDLPFAANAGAVANRITELRTALVGPVGVGFKFSTGGDSVSPACLFV